MSDRPTGVVRVLLADDDAELRATFTLLIDSDPRLHVVATAGDGAAAVRLARTVRPDVVVMDVRMPHLDGIEATRQIVAANAGAKVLVLTMFDLDEHVFAALSAGACGFLLKNARPQELLDAVHVVASGEALLAPTVTRRLIETFRDHGQPPGRDLRLTARESQTLELVGRGLSNQEIASALVLSHATVRTYISRLLDKLDARDRAQLVIAAYDAGLVGRGRSPAGDAASYRRSR
jgi:DNA-binding NarL/FixJ family response regulator